MPMSEIYGSVIIHGEHDSTNRQKKGKSKSPVVMVKYHTSLYEWMIWMLNHCIMMNECKEVPFSIVHQEEVPFGYPDAGLYRQLELKNQGTYCPDCGTWTTKVHEYHPKRVIAGSHNNTPIIDYFNHRRFVCEPCGRTFMEPLPWLHPYQRITEIGHEANL